MKDNYNIAKLLYWIAAPSARNDGRVRHCEESKTTRQSSTRGYRSPQAFSLIELLISLIVVSLILSAFAPIITTKLKHRETAISSSKVGKDCSEKFSEECMICSDDECMFCANLCPTGQYLDEDDSCKCKSCSNIFPNCAKCTKNYCEICNEGYKAVNGRCQKITCSPGYYLSGSSCLPCVNPCKTCTSAAYCTGCEPGYELVGGQCKRESVECSFTYKNTPYTIENAIKFTNGSKTYCMTATNMGDGAYANIPNAAGIPTVTSSTTNCVTTNHRCCWKHESTATSTGVPSPNPGFDYAPQGRTLCTNYAAQQMCSKVYSPVSGLSWHLPTRTELQYLATDVNNDSTGSCTFSSNSTNVQRCAGKLGLQLCDDASGYGSPYCDDSASCLGPSTKYGKCYPSELWSDTAGSQGGRWHAYFSGGILYEKYDFTIYSGRSVRCILGPF